MKKAIKKLMLLVVVLLAASPVSAYDFEVDGIYYNVVSLADLTAEVTKGGSAYTFETFSIPTEVAYMGRTFSIVKIGDSAFYGCNSLTSVIIPESVTSIGHSAFSGCSNLISVTIPESVTSIDNYAFRDCSSLKKVIVKNLTLWCSISFGNSASNPLYDAKRLYRDENTEITDLVIPDDVTSISSYAFYNCSSLTSVVIPNMTSIGTSAFYHCDNLKSITIQGSIQNPYKSWYRLIVFEKCTNLNIVQISNNVESIDDYVFDINSANYKEIIIDDCEQPLNLGYTESAQYYMYYNGGYKWFNYYGCFHSHSLEKIYLGRNLSYSTTNARYDAIYAPFGSNNSGIKEIYIGDYVTNLDGLAFDNHGALETLTIGKGLSEVPNLSNKSKLTSLTLTSEVPQAASEFTNAQYLNLKVYVPKGSLAAYQSADVWKNFWCLQEFDPTGINDAILNTGMAKEVKRYDAAGREIDGQHKGLNIIKMSDGTTKKIMVK